MIEARSSYEPTKVRFINFTCEIFCDRCARLFKVVANDIVDICNCVAVWSYCPNSHLKAHLLLEPATFGSIRRLEDRKGANFYQLAIAYAAKLGLAESENHLIRHHLYR